MLLRMGETGTPFVQRDVAPQRGGLQGKVWGSSGAAEGGGGAAAQARGAWSRDEAEWKELPSPLLCSPSDCRRQGRDRWLGFRALEDS